MTDKTIEQQAAEKYPRFHPYAEYENELQMARREGYIAGRTASANEEHAAGVEISDRRKALIWWGHISAEDKARFADSYFNRKWQTLTGREVQLIFSSQPPASSPKEIASTGGEWQLCPKCNGQGIVSRPPYVAGDVNHWLSDSTSYVCNVCNGAKILAKPLPSQLTGVEVSEGQDSLRAKMEQYFATVDPEQLVKDFEKMGYKFEPISEGQGEEESELDKSDMLTCYIQALKRRNKRIKKLEKSGYEQFQEREALKKRIAEKESQLSEGTAKGGEEADAINHFRAALVNNYFGDISKSVQNLDGERMNKWIATYYPCDDKRGQEAKAIAEKELLTEIAYWLKMYNESEPVDAWRYRPTFRNLHKKLASYLSQFSSPTENEK